MKRSILLSLGWLISCAIFLFAATILIFDWTFMRFEASLDLLSAGSAAGMLTALVAIWFLARAGHDRITRWFSFVLSLVCAAFAVDVVLPSGSTPLWFDVSLLAVLTLPLGIWLWWQRVFRKRGASWKA